MSMYDPHANNSSGMYNATAASFYNSCSPAVAVAMQQQCDPYTSVRLYMALTSELPHAVNPHGEYCDEFLRSRRCTQANCRAHHSMEHQIKACASHDSLSRMWPRLNGLYQHLKTLLPLPCDERDEPCQSYARRGTCSCPTYSSKLSLGGAGTLYHPIDLQAGCWYERPARSLASHYRAEDAQSGSSSSRQQTSRGQAVNANGGRKRPWRNEAARPNQGPSPRRRRRRSRRRTNDWTIDRRGSRQEKPGTPPRLASVVIVPPESDDAPGLWEPVAEAPAAAVNSVAPFSPISPSPPPRTTRHAQSAAIGVVLTDVDEPEEALPLTAADADDADDADEVVDRKDSGDAGDSPSGEACSG